MQAGTGKCSGRQSDDKRGQGMRHRERGASWRPCVELTFFKASAAVKKSPCWNRATPAP